MFINKVFGIDRIFQKISVHTLSCLALFLEMLVTLLHLILRMFSCHLFLLYAFLSLFTTKMLRCLGNNSSNTRLATWHLYICIPLNGHSWSFFFMACLRSFPYLVFILLHLTITHSILNSFLHPLPILTSWYYIFLVQWISIQNDLFNTFLIRYMGYK